MPALTPIYTAENVKFAYQIRWAMTLFTSGTRPMESTLDPVVSALELDGIRVLSHRYAEPSMVQLTLSVKPHLSPQTIVQRVKGRLWYAWKDESLVKIEKKYSLRSYGTQEREIIEKYVAGQASHHTMATEKATALFEGLTLIDQAVELAKPLEISNSLLWYNLHIVLVHVERWRTVNERLLQAVRDMIRKVCKKYEWRLSRCGIVADHLHMALGANSQDAAEDVCLRLMNNLAFVHDMKPIYCYSAYVATFGEYDQRALQ